MSSVNPYTTPQGQSGVGFDGDYEPQVFSFSGRIGRLRYLAYSLCWSLIGLLVLGAGLGLLGSSLGGEAGSDAMMILGGLLMFVGYVVMLIGTFVVLRRRLNDLDQSGWLSLLMLVPLINIALGLYLTFGSGTQGSNRFGPQPCANSTLVVIAALAFPIIMIVGIVAAVALPAYQDYTLRAQGAANPASQAMPYIGDVQTLIMEYAVENQTFPEQNSDINIGWRSESQYIESIDVTTGGKITVVLLSSDEQYNGQTLEFIPYLDDGYVAWECDGGTLAAELRPISCTP